MILELEFIFPAGRFHGEEWPPSPARVFQALVAGTHRGVHGLIHQDRRDDALRWLEAQPPPAVLAPAATPGSGHLDNYVPNNDDNAPAGHVRTAKTLGVHAFPAGGVAAYRWTFEGDGTHADVVAAMASLVTYLGQTADGVFCRGRVHHTAPPVDPADGRTLYGPREVPGGAWLAPAPGFFDLCKRRYPRSVSTEPPDFTNSRQLVYAPLGEAPAEPLVPLAIFSLERLDGRSPWWPEQVREPAGLVRNALVNWARTPSVRRAFGEDRVARLLTGHRAANDPAPADGDGHFGIVPLPSLNDAGTADGRFRRLALVGWGARDATERTLFEEAARALHNAPLHDRRDANGNRACATLQRMAAGSERHWVQWWTAPSRHWRSVTPIVLTGWLRPGRTLDRLVARTLGQAGHPPEAIESVATSAGPLVPHTLPARTYRIGQEDAYLHTSPRCHVEVTFRQPVAGPLVLGRGRFAGLGLCLPLR